MKANIFQRIHLINKIKKNKIKKATNKIKKRFEIEKEIKPVYRENINYFIEYWKTYYDNEYILAKIKEIVYEINSMEQHVKELKEIKNNKL